MSLCSTWWYCTLFLSHCDLLLGKHNCISYAWLEVFEWGP